MRWRSNPSSYPNAEASFAAQDPVGQPIAARFVVTVLQGGEPMSGELEITTQDGKIYWFGRDERFPAEVRIYGADTHHWQYLPTERARQIVRESLENGGEVQQGDPLLFFTDQEQASG
jgi:hypothetical protein